jgi:uncharacterized membrane protein YdfJ with MMPL/SSD domain
VTTFFSSGDRRLVSADRHATGILVGLPDEAVDPAVADVQRVDRDPVFVAGITGDHTVGADFDQLSQDDLRTGELFFGLPAELIILILVFGAVVAGVIPVISALIAIVVALALTALVGQAFDLSVFVVNMITGMGLALGIDYAALSLLGDRVNSLRVPYFGRTLGQQQAFESRFRARIVSWVMSGACIEPRCCRRAPLGRRLAGVVPPHGRDGHQHAPGPVPQQAGL